jgi:alkylation response protein AidB-like acyl-CoA dehydrogenase
VRFDLSDVQDSLSASVTAVLRQECTPDRLRSAIDSDSAPNERLWDALSSLGLFGIALPEECGGIGGGLLDLAVAAEALGYAAAPAPFVEHALATLAIAFSGTPEQAARWLPPLLSGSRQATLATLDTDPFWSPDRWTTKPGDPLVGRATTVLGAASADIIVVGLAGGFAVADMNDPAVAVDPVDVLDRTRPIGRVVLDAPAYETLAGDAMSLGRIRDAALVLLAADAAGGAAHCLDAAVRYAKSREQFGVSIGHFQAVKHHIAGMALACVPTRTLYWYAAHALDQGSPDSARAAAVAKAQLTESFVSVARGAIDVHGGFGYTWECDLHIWLKRAILDRAIFGGPEVHRARVAELSGW